MKKICYPSIFIFLLSSCPLFAQSKIGHRVFLLGNFADIQNHSALKTQLEDAFDESSSPFTLILNGDVVDWKKEEMPLEEQLAPLLSVAQMMQAKPNGNLIVLPGDRDWNSGQKGGEKKLRQVEKSISMLMEKNELDRCIWPIEDGCPGPEVIEVDESLAILTLNTQWWNHPYDKPRPSDATCDGLLPENLKEALEDAVEDNHERNVLIVGHHPIHSLGNYGGYFSFGDYFKPFPIIGLFRTAFHANVGNQFDLANERLTVFVEEMNNLLYFHDNLIYASGHERNQQIINFRNNFLINSGAAEKGGYATEDEQTLFASKSAGIIRIDYFENGKVETQFLKNESGQFSPSENHLLFHSTCGAAAESATGIPNTAYVPCKETVIQSAKMERKYPGLTAVAAGPEYEANGWKRIWFGKHYRTTWMEPVQVPYLDLDETFDGLTIYKKGGGRQTTSLKFRSGDGSVYTFRSVNKDPAKALNYRIRNTIAREVIRDQTSTQHPFGAMAVAPLLEEVDILHATPKLYVLPDDSKLGPFQKKYGNLFGMLEENPGKKNNAGEHFGGADKIEKSLDVFDRFYRKQKTKVNKEEFVRARLFDILIGDWSKHEDNWKWAAFKENGVRVYRPIPRDRDHAFSRQDGFINWLADRPFGVQNIENFGLDFTGIQSLTFQAKHMDRFLMAEAPKSVFMEQAKFIQDNISDEDIEKAVAQFPKEVYELSGKTIETKLKNRVKHLHEAAEVYYGLLAKEVDVVGSKEEEYFVVDYQSDGSVKVSKYDMNGSQKGTRLLYERVFYPSETKEVRLWGLGDDDSFEFTGSEGKIRVRAFGGPGQDTFKDRAQAKTLLYDKGNETVYETEGKAKVVNHWNKALYEYDRLRFNYNYSLPLIYFSYSVVTGFGLNFGRTFTIRRFDKDEYHSQHSVGLSATTEGNASARYSGRFHQAIRRWDFMVNANYENPMIRNRFFGLGNDTENLENERGRDFYQSKIKVLQFSLGLVRDFWQQSSFSFQFGFESNESQQIDNTFLNENFEDIYGAHRTLDMVPIRLGFNLDFRDEQGLPYRGARALVNYEYSTLLTDVPQSSNFGLATGEIEYYLSSKREHPITLGLRIGGSMSHGDVPWYKLPTLGSATGLRGYVEDRFAGDDRAYINTELRYQFAERQTALVPIKAGVKIFYDYGRVFHNEANGGGDWRSGYGVGFYVVPLDELITIALSFGISDEESIYPIFSIGTPLR